jgi:small GTP-binding protein
MRLLLIGDNNCGKSSIIEYYRNNKYIKYINKTIGIDKHNMEINIINNNKKIKYEIQLIDTPGDDKYNKLIKLYCDNIVGILLIFDITNYDSYKNLEKWLYFILINNNIKREHILLIGNKYDLNEDRVVSYDLAYSFMIKNNLGGYIETSAKTGFNINFILTKITQDIYNCYYGHTNEVANNKCLLS